jgi:hypothetical protein
MFQQYPCSWPSLNGRDPCSPPPISTRQSRGFQRLRYLSNSFRPLLLPRYFRRTACLQSASRFGVNNPLSVIKIIEVLVQSETSPRRFPIITGSYLKEPDSDADQEHQRTYDRTKHGFTARTSSCQLALQALAGFSSKKVFSRRS